MAMVLEEMAVMRMRCELHLNTRGSVRLRAAPPAPLARDNHVLRYRRDAEVLLTHSRSLQATEAQLRYLQVPTPALRLYVLK